MRVPPLHVTQRALALAVGVVLIAACSAGAPSAPGRASPSAASATSAASGNSGSVALSSAGSPPPSAASSPVAVRPGEPWLVFAWYPDVLYLVRPDGSDRHPIDIAAPGVKFAPAWSPDGARIVFVMRGDSSATPNGSIWTAKPDGSDARMLYDGKGECDGGAFWPSWSPDGKQLALICYRGAAGGDLTEVSILDPVSMKRTDLAAFTYPDTIDNPPSWSPDGSALTFEIITWDPTDSFVKASVVATVPTAGGQVKRLTDPALFGGHPDWSPDGSLIAFNTYDTGNIHGIDKPSNIYTIAPDGAGLRQLSTASTDGKMRLGQPFWSPDGSRIWVSVARDWEKDSNDQFKNTLGWVDARTGELHEIGTEGKRFRERPTP